MGDAGFLACNSELGKSGKTIGGERWNRRPLDRKIYSAVNPYLADTAHVLRWLSHENPNGTSTIVVEDSPPDEDLGYWIVASRDRGAITVKVTVSAVGFGFSKSSSRGVNGLWFCTKRGLSHEWIWRGSAWQAGGRPDD
jgi:hypothetical protein